MSFPAPRPPARVRVGEYEVIIDNKRELKPITIFTSKTQAATWHLRNAKRS